MAWIELHQSVFRHPKTEHMAKALSLERECVVGYLASLWCWALDALPPTGGPTTPADVKLGANWPGDESTFFQAALAAGYVEQRRKNGRYYLRNWPKYAGKLNERRVLARERKSRERAKAKLNVTRDSHTDVTPTNPTNQPNLPTSTVSDLDRSSLSNVKTRLKKSDSRMPPLDSDGLPPGRRLTFGEAVRRFETAQPNERVARLVDLGDNLGFPRNGGHAAAIVKRYGHGRDVSDAAYAYVHTSQTGDPWEYMEGVLRRERRTDQTRPASTEHRQDEPSPFTKYGSRS